MYRFIRASFHKLKNQLEENLGSLEKLSLNKFMKSFYSNKLLSSTLFNKEVVCIQRMAEYKFSNFNFSWIQIILINLEFKFKIEKVKIPIKHLRKKITDCKCHWSGQRVVKLSIPQFFYLFKFSFFFFFLLPIHRSALVSLDSSVGASYFKFHHFRVNRM